MSLSLTSSFTLAIAALACLVCSENEQMTSLKLLVLPSRSETRSSRNGRRQNVTRYRTKAVNTANRQLLSDDHLDSYIKDGYVVISGLLGTHELDSLVDAGNGIISKHLEKLEGKPVSKGNYQVYDFGLILDDKGVSSGEGMENTFRGVALHSNLPKAAAELMQLDSETQNLRVLRDVFLAKGHAAESSCGWHVDDQMFWPASYQLPQTGTVDQSGINAWVALDDMPVEYGGSLAVSPQSHSGEISWRDEALTALGFKDSLGNGISKEDLFEIIKGGKVDTCGLEKMAPQIHDEIEKSKKEFHFKKGDVIFMNRWLFHKSSAMTEEGKLALQAIEKSLQGDIGGGALLKRYSVRYVTGSTSLPQGFMTEMSVLASGGSNLGKELNNVTGEWYPQCWPEVDSNVDQKIDYLVKNEVPVAQAKLGAIMAEVMSLFQSR